MSAICVVTRVEPAEVDELQSGRLRPGDYLANHLPAHYGPRGSRWFGSPTVESQAADSHATAAHDDRHLSLDKSWHALHYLLTGTAGEGELPASFLLRGGQILGQGAESLAHASHWQRMIAAGGTVDELHTQLGPPRLLIPAEVCSAAGAVAKLSWEELQNGYVPAAMQSLYPQYWFDDPLERGPKLYLKKHFVRLQAFLAESARRKSGLLIHFIAAVVL
jgi:hypothetical protein